MNKITNRLLLAFTLVAALFTTQALADGLPGEYFVTQRWRDLMASHSPATNPAFLTESNYVTVRGAFSPSMSNSFVLYETGATIPLGLYQSVGVSMLGVTANDPIQVSEWDATAGQIVATGKEFKDSHFRAMISYAINPWNRLSVGANVNIYYDPNFGDAIVGFALDLGLSYRVSNHPILGEHLVGISFQNAISPDFQFEELQQQSINAKVSWVGRIWERRIEAGIDLDFKDFTAQAANFAVPVQDVDGNWGYIEGEKKLEFDFNFRLGFWMMRMMNLYGHFGTGYWGISGGMNVPTIFGGRDFQVAYQYMSVTDDALAYTHTIYFRGEFGPNREEIYARKKAREYAIGPGNLYNQAREWHAEGKYWDAFFLFGKIKTEYPDFFKNDWVNYFMANCQENMEMRELANETYNATISEYSTSAALFHSRLGLMRVNYRDQNYYGVESEYNLLAVSAAPDSVKEAAAYYMGSTRLNEGNYTDAISYFSKVPALHSDYPFAQHSLAIASAMINNYDNTLLHLDNAIQYVPVEGESYTDDQEEIINRSYLILGFLYYEGKASGGRSLVKAVASLREVDSDSYYYTDALLGRAWVALKSNAWTDVQATAAELRSTTDNVELQSEADLMIAYGHMVTNNWQAAYTTLSTAVDAMGDYSAPTTGELSGAEDQYYTNRGDYYTIAQTANELANVRQGSYVIAQMDSLRPLAESSEASIRSFGVFKDDHARATFFGRNADAITGDLTYALSKARERVGTLETSGAAADAAEDAAEAAAALEAARIRREELMRMLEESENSSTEE